MEDEDVDNVVFLFIVLSGMLLLLLMMMMMMTMTVTMPTTDDGNDNFNSDDNTTMTLTMMIVNENDNYANKNKNINNYHNHHRRRCHHHRHHTYCLQDVADASFPLSSVGVNGPKALRSWNDLFIDPACKNKQTGRIYPNIANVWSIAGYINRMLGIAYISEH